MAQLQTLETKVAMKSPEKIAAFFRDSITVLPQLVPDLVKTAEVMGGGQKMGPGSLMLVTYTLPGAPLSSAKVKWEAMGEEEADQGKALTLTAIEGEILEMYRSFSVKIEMDCDAGHVGWTIQYELASPNVPPPHSYLEVCKQLTKVFDNYC